jgi:hypothetical protein
LVFVSGYIHKRVAARLGRNCRGVFIAVLFFKLIFGGFDGFMECVLFWFQYSFISGVISAAHGDDGTERKWGSLQLFIWVALSVGCSILAYYQLPGWLPAFFG